MAHYSFINEENIVVEVITGKDEDDLETLPEGFESWENYYESKRDGLICKRTSYNTSANEHILGGTAFRGNYAGIGFTYDVINDVFYSPQPFDSWTISEESNWLWKAPVDYPSDANQDFDINLPLKVYEWNEDNYQADNTAGWELIKTYEYNSETELWEEV